MGHFKVKSKINLNEAELGTVIPESDYSALTEEGKFVQLEYFEDDDKVEPYIVKSGTYTIVKTMAGLKLEPTSFIKDSVLDSLVNTKDIENKADCFFKNAHRYKEFGLEIAKRNILLYGPAGSGKSTGITKICQNHSKDGKTAVVIFPTVNIEAYQVKDFIKSFEYQGAEKLILIMEDIGGFEKDEIRVASDSGLLALLDNNEKTFKVSTLIIATTNFPEVFMSNIMNRPGRFDDKIEVGFPDANSRYDLLKFFLKAEPNAKTVELIKSKKCETFTPAHIREIIVRAAIYDKTHEDVIADIVKEIELYSKGFSKRGSVGLM